MFEELKMRLQEKKHKDGFTLIELIISITIFMIFLGLVSQSYLSIVTTQRRANEVRKMYSEVRGFMDTLAEDIRLSAIDYECYEGVIVIGSGSFCVPEVANSINQGRTDLLSLVKKDGLEKTLIKNSYDYEEKIYSIQMQKWHKKDAVWEPAPGFEGGYRDVFSDKIAVDYVSFAIFPDINPYSAENYSNNAAQFQPKVTVFLSVGNSKGVDAKFNYDFQTTISSRVYSRSK